MIALHWRLLIAAVLLAGCIGVGAFGELDAQASAYVWGLVTVLSPLVLDLLRAADARRRSSRPPAPPPDRTKNGASSDPDKTPTERPPRPRKPWLPLLALAVLGGCGASMLEAQADAAAGARGVLELSRTTIEAAIRADAQRCVDASPSPLAAQLCVGEVSERFGPVVTAHMTAVHTHEAWIEALLLAYRAGDDPDVGMIAELLAGLAATWRHAREAAADIGFALPPLVLP